MDKATEVAEKDLTKDDLANCCRLCSKAKPRDPHAASFFPLYERCDRAAKDREGDEGFLYKRVNEWLPVKVSPDDLNYPRNICSTCFYHMEDTIPFFKKVKYGQNRIMKAINNTNPLSVPGVNEADNLATKIRRPRGRPRKDKDSPVVKTKPAEVNKENCSSVAESKGKRITKLPERFGGYLNPFSKTLLKELGDDEDTVIHRNSLGIKDEDTSPSPDSASLISHQFTSVREIDLQLDLNKLDVLMDGDEETVIENETVIDSMVTVESTLHSSDIEDSELVKVEHPTENLGVQQEGPGIINSLFVGADQDDREDLDFSVQPHKSRRKRGRPPKGSRRKTLKFQRRFVCAYSNCTKAFTTDAAKRYHVERVHEARIRFPCSICQKGFTHARLLKLHVMTHSAEKKFRCNECPKAFKSMSSLFAHNKGHHVLPRDSTRFQCEFDGCVESFTLKSSLKSHIRIHTGLRPYACYFCGKTFTQQSNLKAHERIHNNNRPFKCSLPDCTKAFKTRTQQKMHELSHAVTKSHLCPTCGKGFRTQSSFRAHMLNHGGVRPFGCSLCLKRFATARALKAHGYIHIQKQQCACGMEFQNRKIYHRHKKTCSPSPLMEVSSTTNEQEVLTMEVTDAEMDEYGYAEEGLANEGEEEILISATEVEAGSDHQGDLIQLVQLYPEGSEGLEDSGGAAVYYYVLGMVDQDVT